jgi:nitrogen PTS system EIIA component
MAMNSPNALRLAGLLVPTAIELQLKAAQRDDVLSELVNLIPSLTALPEARESLRRALLEREQLHSTGIGDGIALPHTRSPLPGLLTEPMIVYGRHPLGIAFGAIDGTPVRQFFLLAATNVSQHLHILARISRLLRQPAIRQGLLSASTPQRVLDIFREAEAHLP